jgi:uncharacterized repeat protein (TIGR02059 family)
MFVSASNFHLQSSSPAISAGIPIATPSITADCEGSLFNSTPEIGAFKSGTTVVVPPTTPVSPVYQSSAVANATPSLLEMTYDITLGNIVPAASAFNVLVNSATYAVSSVAISGTKVQLTLSSPIKFGDIVTVTYTKPATTPLQGSTGGLVANISTKPVTNNLASSAKTEPPLTVTIALSPYYVHKTLNVTLTYSITPTTTSAPKTLQITDLSGKLVISKAITQGATSVTIPLNLTRGIYNISTSGGTAPVVVKKFRVF